MQEEQKRDDKTLVIFLGAGAAIAILIAFLLKPRAEEQSRVRVIRNSLNVTVRN